MRCIIAGSREGVTRADVDAGVEASGWADRISTVVCGGARGADTFGFDWAWERQIPVQHFLPEWSRHGKKAGIIRNTEMARNADALIAIWNGKSRGTEHMIEEARRLHLRIWIHRVDKFPDRETEG